MPFLGSMLGFGGGKTTVDPNSPTFKRQQGLGDLSKNFAFDTALPEGQKLLGQAESTLQQPIDYWSKLLGGDRAEMMSAVAPEAKTIMNQYDSAKNNISKFTPYGGGQTSLLSELPFKEAGDIQTLIQKLRPAAAGELGQLGAEQGKLSGQITNEGLTSAGQAGDSFSSMLDALLGQSKQNAPMQNEMGGALATLLLGG